MKFIADFHIHSKYSRATSKDMDIEHIAEWAKWKGIKLMGTGDFTHPFWFSELKKKLKPAGNGLFQFNDTYFILTSEVSNIFSKGGKVRKVHNMIFAPSFDIVEKINRELGRICNLTADGRPMMGLTAKRLLEIVLGVSPECLVVPCHAWTPWFSIFGANSGFDSLEECFEELTKYIYAIETGLSSDPAMNWRLSALDNITLISCSDAHSPAKIGREACVMDAELDYKEIIQAIKKKDKNKLLSTIEFFPEEGKYHYDGHRACNILWSPKETKENKGICPVCKRRITVGVINRVDSLADRPLGFTPNDSIPYKNVIPLQEVISDAIGKEPGTAAVGKEYMKLVQKFGSEFEVLLDTQIEDLKTYASERISQGISRMREGKVKIIPGHDGVYGKIRLFDEEEEKSKAQMGLF